MHFNTFFTFQNGDSIYSLGLSERSPLVRLRVKKTNENNFMLKQYS